MEYLVGAGLALAVSAFAALAGFDRERSPYPLMLTVIASYYVLFAATTGNAAVVAREAAPVALFGAAAVIGLRNSLWLVVLALIGHGLFDLVHQHMIDDAGIPDWWPRFCMAYDLGAAAALAWRLSSGRAPHQAFGGRALAAEGFAARIRPHVTAELTLARHAEAKGDVRLAFHHLERAHVLGQASTVQHVRAHAHMLGWACRAHDGREAAAQLLRMVGAATKTAFGLIPIGNTGGGDVCAFQPLPIPADLAARIAEASGTPSKVAAIRLRR